MSQAQSLQKKLLKGGLIDASLASRDELFGVARAAGMSAFVVDCDRARSRSAVLRAVVKAVDFPEFFGGNLDAFYDCLCDTVLDHRNGLFLWFHNLHSGDPALADDAQAILSVVNDAVEFASNSNVCMAYAVVHAGAHPAPEPGVDPVPYSGASDN